ncbi:MAG: hypothetical protein NT062_30950 [Proteobacteria bacterium]|nr:hypothetical protein [Pseudomonadota bacterium]
MKQMIATLVLTLTATAALADHQPTAPIKPIKQTQKSAEQLVTDDCARATKAGKQCVVNMDADAVGGSTPTGTGTTVGVLTPGKQPSLIRIRRDFVAEMVKTTEDL